MPSLKDFHTRRETAANPPDTTTVRPGNLEEGEVHVAIYVVVGGVTMVGLALV